MTLNPTKKILYPCNKEFIFILHSQNNKFAMKSVLKLVSLMRSHLHLLSGQMVKPQLLMQQDSDG